MTKPGCAPAVAVVVNDDSTQLGVLCALVRKAGLEPVPYPDAEAALAAMNPAAPPALIVTDLYMPGLDGWRFCRLLRAPEYAAFNEVPILVVSATFAGDHPARIAADTGADAFLPSPVDGKEFAAQVQALLAGKETRRLPRVLIVEDDEDLAVLIERTFSAHGYRADTAFTVREAAAASAATAYDVTVLDYHLPDGKGDALLDALRSRHPDCVCIMMTGDPTPALALDWMKRGAAAHLHKPFAPEFLVELCARARRERALLRAEDLLEARTRELRESEERYRIFFEGISDAAFVHEVNQEGRPGRFLEVNAVACRRLGYTREELLGLTPRDITDPGEYERLARWRGQLGDRGNVLIETVHVAKDGTKIPVESNICRISYRERPATLSVSRDITARKQVELALERREALLDAALRASGLLLAAETPAEVLGEIVRLLGAASGQDRTYYFAWHADSTTGKITISLGHEWVREGIAPQQNNPLLQELPFDQVAPYSCGRLRQGLEACALVRDLPASEREVLEPQGIVSLLLMPVMVDGVPAGFLGFDNCRTEYAWTAGERAALAVVATNLGAALVRSRTEEALQRQEVRYRSIVEHLNDAFYIHDFRGRITDLNENACRKTGYSREELLAGGLQLIDSPEETAAVPERMASLMEKGTLLFEGVHRRKDGEPVFVGVSARVVSREGDGRVQSFVRDITGRKRAEEEMQIRSSAMASAVSGIALSDLEGRINYVNAAWLKMHGYDSPGEVLGTTPLDHVQDPAVGNEVLRTLKTESRWIGELMCRRRDGSTFPAELVTNVVTDSAGRPLRLFASFSDITQRKQAEEEREKLQAQLIQAQKMESVGRLAGGVAHDFNNMLTAILGNATLALEDLPPESPLRESLEEIQKSALRSADLTRQLLAFARRQTIAPKVLDLNETVTGMLKMLRRLIGEDIDLAWLPGADLGPVNVDPSQVDQILANLCVNARDAIGGHVGTITIETGNAAFDETYVAEHPEAHAGEYVRLAVSDNGCGMSPEVQAHLFEPFFTTKGLGQGTGLGLATVYGIVKQNHGFISVCSEPGQGTTFEVFLPRHTVRAACPAAEASAPAPRRGHETILLVEDEPSILRMGQRMLENLGYRVLVARTPGEALQLAREHAGEIHLLITDVVMPEMNGRDLAKNLLGQFPNLKRLFMSGYTADVIAHHGVLDPGIHFLQKPFTIESFADKVREALHQE